MEQHRGDKEMEGQEEVVVVDASVIAKWFVEEEHSDRALDLRDDYVARAVEITAPELLPFEVLNSLRYNPEFGEGDLKQATRALEGYDMWLFPMLGELAQKIAENAYTYGISVYDASYISLGELRETTLYTADAKLLGKVRAASWVRHISEYRRRTPRG